LLQHSYDIAALGTVAYITRGSCRCEREYLFVSLFYAEGDNPGIWRRRNEVLQELNTVMPSCIEQDYIGVQPRTLLSGVQCVGCADDIDLIPPGENRVQAFLHDPNIAHDENAQGAACFQWHR
jgi:hypothetical protein